MFCEEWDAAFGKDYKACIDTGALTVMIDYIMQPKYLRKLCPGIKDEDIMPATIAPELTYGHLREQLGFNGKIVSAATTMVVMCIPMARNAARSKSSRCIL